MASLRMNILLFWAISLTSISGTRCQIISLLENITVTSQTTASILSQTNEKMENHLAQQTQLITQMVATQTSMAGSLEQIVSLLQMQNQRIVNLTDCQCQQDETTSSPTLTTVTTPNEPTTQMQSLPVDCSNVSATENQGSGVYTIDPKDGMESFNAFCDMDTHPGGWIVFQKRFDGAVDFFLGWDTYEQGFGNVSGEYWLGLQQIHRLTTSGQWTLRIDMEDFDGNIKYAQYEDFKIGDAASFYQLSIGAFSGTVGFDALTSHNGSAFSTKDSDHDACSHSRCQSFDSSCALAYQGAWWYVNCHNSNLNGLYQGSISPVPNYQVYSLMCWDRFSGSGYTPIKKSEMKILCVQ